LRKWYCVCGVQVRKTNDGEERQPIFLYVHETSFNKALIAASKMKSLYVLHAQDKGITGFTFDPISSVYEMTRDWTPEIVEKNTHHGVSVMMFNAAGGNKLKIIRPPVAKS